MPRGGQNRKPTALKIVEGTARPSRMVANEPQPEPAANRVPSWLTGCARECWQRNAPQLIRLGVLTEIDVDLFCTYCLVYARIRTAEGKLRQLDPESEAYRPVAVTIEKAETMLRAIASEFGMSPVSRSRLSVKPVERGNPFEEFVSGHQRTS